METRLKKKSYLSTCISLRFVDWGYVRITNPATFEKNKSSNQMILYNTFFVVIYKKTLIKFARTINSIQRDIVKQWRQRYWKTNTAENNRYSVLVQA